MNYRKVRVCRNPFQRYPWERYIISLPDGDHIPFEHFWAALAHALYITKPKEKVTQNVL